MGITNENKRKRRKEQLSILDSNFVQMFLEKMNARKIANEINGRNCVLVRVLCCGLWTKSIYVLINNRIR